MCKLRELFGKDCGTVNSTHLKERILDVFPDLTAHTKDRNKVHLVLKHEIGGICQTWERTLILTHVAWHEQHTL